MRFKRLISALALLSVLCSCRPSAEEYIDFLYSSMPLSDSLVFPRAYWEANVAKTLEVRDKMDWNIPEREFRHFVLPLRVNNEDLDNFRTAYADTLCRRVQGMSIGEAALEINHWCHEQATYRPSDSRTLGPEATIRSGLGRCGEESVLAVAALRAAGIPARQVYTPRWAHTDDNHAWVEVWADGEWHFMGACEPEPVLDLAWFNAPVSRAMLLHTKVYGKDYDGPEDVISRTHAYTEINVIKGYIPSRRSEVRIVDAQGRPVEGASVEFKIYNYAEFYTVAKYLSDEEGFASLDTGKGDLFVWASKGDLFGMGVLHEGKGEVVLDKSFGEPYSLDFDIIPPAENPLPDKSSVEQKEMNARRLEEEDAIRASHPHPKATDPGLWLSEKDLIDVSGEVIDDALNYSKKQGRYLSAPRIEREMLHPYRQEILASGIDTRLRTPAEAVAWVKDSIRIDDTRNPQQLRIPPFAVWRSRIADSGSRDIFFVALCRTLGWPARINSVTGAVQYKDGGDAEDGSGWVDVDFDSGKREVLREGTLIPRYDASGSVKTPKYYSHFTISEIRDGSVQLCGYDDFEPLRSEYKLPEGYYMLCSGMRMADGSVRAHVELFPLPAGETVRKTLVLRDSQDKPQVIGTMDAEQLFLREGESVEQSILSATGRGYFLVCVTGTRDEPSLHLKSQLEENAAALNDWGCRIVLLGGIRPRGLDNVVFGSDVDAKVAGMLRAGVESSRSVLPITALCDSFGRIIYYSEGYDTSLGQQLVKLLPLLSANQ